LPESFSTAELLELYKIAIDEYRFEVRLNWDRTTYHLILNSGLISIATGLLKVGSVAIVNLFVAGVFFVGFCASLIGIKAITQGHRYYRRTIVKKTLIEDLLGLTLPNQEYPMRHSLSVGTTHGHAEYLQILHNTDTWLRRGLQPRSITFWIVGILSLLCVMNLVGVWGSVWLFYHPDGQRLLQVPIVVPVLMM
jgi:hypothetical protein